MKYFLICLLLASVSACASVAPSGPERKQSALEGEVHTFLNTYAKAFNQRDISGMLALYAENAAILVSGPQGGEHATYALDRDGLANSLELKKPVWELEQVRLAEFEVQRMRPVSGGAMVDVRWQVRSKPWSGEYETAFMLKRVGRDLQILHEQAPDSK